MSSAREMAIHQARIDYGIEDARIRKGYQVNLKVLEAEQKQRRKELEAQHREENNSLLDVRRDQIIANKDRLKAVIEAAHR